MAGFYPGGQFDPAATIGEDDPLRDWAKNLDQDPVLGTLLLTDPQKAIDHMVAKGIPPPSASAYTDPMGGVSPGDEPNQPATPTSTTPAPATVPGVIRSDPVATERWRQDTPATPFDPEASTPIAAPTIPVPAERPAAAGPGASDISASAKKKPELGDALGDFSKSLAGVKPLPPPPLNAVGTPSVRSPTASGAPNLATLLQYFGQQSQPSPLSTLGRLLVAGKA